MTTKQSPSPLAGGDGATSEEQLALNSTKRDKSESCSARLNRSRPVPYGQPIDFDPINRAALAAFPAVLARILPGGKRVGAEFVALNPRRRDRHLGSFKINIRNGRWADFATGDRGGDRSPRRQSAKSRKQLRRPARSRRGAKGGQEGVCLG
jgi:hypothetical protein